MKFTIDAAVLALLFSGVAQARIHGDRSPVAPLEWKEPSAPATSAPTPPPNAQVGPARTTKPAVAGPLSAMKETRATVAAKPRSATN